MILRGVKFPPPALDRADIEMVQSRGRRGGGGFRQDRHHHGGRFENGNYTDAMAPRQEPKRWRNERNDRNERNERNDNSNGSGPNLNPSNPFAAFINPNFAPNFNGPPGRMPPPPHMAAANGWIPPPPNSYGSNGSNGHRSMPSRGGYGDRRDGDRRDGDRRGGYNGRGYDRY